MEDGVVMRVESQCDPETQLMICQFVPRVGGALPN